MSVFRVCFKIFKKNLPTLMIYFLVFLMVSVIMTIVASPSQVGEFGQTRINIGFFAEEETPLVEGLKTILSPYANFVEIEYEQEKLQEALFYRSIHYILRVPKGFTDSFLGNGDILLSRTQVAGSASAFYLDIVLDRFLTTLTMYLASFPQSNLDTLVNYALEDLSVDTQVIIPQQVNNSASLGLMQYYFNFKSYSIMFSVIFGISAIMLAFNNKDLKRRNLCAPISLQKINFHCYISCVLFALVNWLLLVVVSLIFGLEEAAKPNTWLFALNSFVFTITVTGLAFLISTLTKNNEVTNAVANVITLGTSFLSGVFVPQEFLGENVLRIASFMPTYWYVRGNRLIASLTEISFQHTLDIGISLVVQLVFGVAFIIISLAIAKQKTKTAD